MKLFYVPARQNLVFAISRVNWSMFNMVTMRILLYYVYLWIRKNNVAA